MFGTGASPVLFTLRNEGSCGGLTPIPPYSPIIPLRACVRACSRVSKPAIPGGTVHALARAYCSLGVLSLVAAPIVGALFVPRARSGQDGRVKEPGTRGKEPPGHGGEG